MKQLLSPSDLQLATPYPQTTKTLIREAVLSELYQLLPELLDNYRVSIEEAEGKDRATIIHNLFDRLNIRDGAALPPDGSQTSLAVAETLKQMAAVFREVGVAGAALQRNAEPPPTEPLRNVGPKAKGLSQDQKGPATNIYAHFEKVPDEQ